MPFFPILVPATWAAMSYPDISAVILDASFDDLVPLALKVMPDSWREYSHRPALRGAGAALVLCELAMVPFSLAGSGWPIVEKQTPRFPSP